LPGAAQMPARSAVRDARRRVGALTRAHLLAGDGARATRSRAGETGRTGVVAIAAMPDGARRVDAGSATLRESRCAAIGADSLRADKTRSADVRARSAVQWVVRGVGTARTARGKSAQTRAHPCLTRLTHRARRSALPAISDVGATVDAAARARVETDGALVRRRASVSGVSVVRAGRVRTAAPGQRENARQEHDQDASQAHGVSGRRDPELNRFSCRELASERIAGTRHDLPATGRKPRRTSGLRRSTPSTCIASSSRPTKTCTLRSGWGTTRSRTRRARLGIVRSDRPAAPFFRDFRRHEKGERQAPCRPDRS